MKTADVAVIGAGPIGAAIAWRCAQRGLSVVLADPDPARGAWSAAAGMLAPVTELTYTERTLHALGVESLRRYPAFVAELESLTGRRCGFLRSGTLALAWDGADLRALRDLHAFARSLGVEAALLSGREVRQLEPGVAPGLPGGMYVAGDHQVDPRLLHAALLAAAERAGVQLVTAEATIGCHGDRVLGIRTTHGDVDAGTVVLAAGAWSPLVPGLPMPVPVRPVKGQTLRLRGPAPSGIRPVARADVKGSHVYVVPRADGTVVVGASVEEAGYDVRPRAGAVYELLRDAQSILPELSEATLLDVRTGLRPGSPDNAPLLGPSGIDGLILATGHYRNGILLTPLTADVLAETIGTGGVPDFARPFAAERFAPAVAS